MIIPNALASHDSDKQWGTIYVDSPTFEIPYTSSDNSQPEKLRIFGIVEEPRSSGYIYMTITEPDGKTYQVKVKPNGNYGNYDYFLLICCNNIGTYSAYAEWRGNHIGTVTVDVIQKSQPTTMSTPTTESVYVIPNWIKNNAGWWSEGQISDSSYLLGIQYLLKVGIIKIS